MTTKFYCNKCNQYRPEEERSKSQKGYYCKWCMARKLRAWRASTSSPIAKDGPKAVTRAYARLGKKYPNLLARLIDEEREALGLPPIGMSQVGRPPKART